MVIPLPNKLRSLLAKRTYEIEFLKRNYKILSYKEISKKLGRTYNGVKHKGLKLNLDKINYWTPKQIEFLKKNYREYGAFRCSKIINRSPTAIRMKAYLLKIKYNRQRKHFSPKTEFKKGHIPWLKGLTKETDERVKRLSEKMTGDNSPMRKHPELKEKMIKNIVGYWKGKKRPKEFVENLKKIGHLFKKGEHKNIDTEFKKGIKHKFFNNWSSREPYGPEFSPELKEQIRKRDNYRCQQCFREQNELFIKNKNGKITPRKLDIHHIDFNKKNNNPINLISLCKNCHAQTNFNRENWINYFQNKIKMISQEFIKK